MKLTIILMLAFSALSFGRSFSQNISLHFKNTSLEVIFENIEKQSGYTFFYKKDLLKHINKVSVNIDKKTLSESLNILLKNKGFDYRLHNKFIIISPKKSEKKAVSDSLISSIAKLQSMVSGTVKDSIGNPIAGVTISNINTNATTSTDQSGSFSLAGKSGDVLNISSIGYSSVRYTISSINMPLQITLSPSQQDIDAVVVTALGIKRATKSLSYQIQSIDNEELTTVKSVNFVNSLVGKVAGAQINASSNGPGGAVKVVMRGSKSISSNNNVLYVIDGIPINNSVADGGDGQFSIQPGTEGIADLNPDDIESLSVLSGPSAAALYGNEGANGVILVTTKRGAAGKTSLTISHNSMFSNPLLMPDFQTKYGNESGSVMSWGEEKSTNFSPSDFFNTGTTVNNVISLSTGNDKSQNYFSLASNNSTGILPNNKYNRYNFYYRNTTNFLDNKFVMNVSANYIIQNNRNMVSQGQYFNPLPALYLFPRGEDFSSVQLFERYNPVSEVNNQYWIYGDQSLSIQNPYWTMYRMNRDANRSRYLFTTSLLYHITEDLNITGRINVDNTHLENTDNRYASTLGALAGPKGRHTLGTREDRQVYGDLIATYKKDFDRFNVNINAGGSIKNQRMNAYTIEGDLQQITNYFSIENMNRAVGTFKTDANGLTRQVQSVFANAELGYNNALFFSLTGRNDWDSALAYSLSPERSFFYYSTGLSAVFSDILTLPEWFTYLKARGSYTQVGNSYNPFSTTEQYQYDSQTHTYSLPRIRPNFFLKPERTNSYEFGLDFRFLENALSLSATYYNSNTTRQTHTVLESSTEYDGKIVQTGNVQNRGAELMLGYQNSWDKFSWHTNVTYSINKNKILSLYGDDILAENPNIEQHVDKATLGSIGSPIVRLTEGGTMGDIYMTSDFQRDNNGYILLNPSTLLPSMKTLSSNEFKKLGTLLPTSFVGWRNSFNYDNIRLNIVLSGRFGGLVVSNTQAIMDRYGVSQYSADAREKGGINILNNEISSKDYFNIVAEGTGKADNYVYSADNVRLQELSIEYTLNKKFLKNIASTTIGIVGNNLALLYHKAPFDPESIPTASSTYYTGVDFFMQPSLRNIGFNVRFNF